MRKIVTAAAAAAAIAALAGCGTGSTASAASSTADLGVSAIAASKCPTPAQQSTSQMFVRTEYKCSDGTALYVFNNQTGRDNWLKIATTMGAAELSHGGNWVVVDDCSSYSGTAEQGVQVATDLYNKWIEQWNGLTQAQRDAFNKSHKDGGFDGWLNFTVPNWKQQGAASIPARCKTAS